MTTIKCPLCGKQVHWYNPRVGLNRMTRVCEHRGQDGKTCPTSRKPLHEVNQSWENDSYETKLRSLEAESSVLLNLLLEDATLVDMIKRGESKDSCLAYINDNW